MRLETLQSLSACLVFLGLLLAALGGFGTLHFSKQIERKQEEEKESSLRKLGGLVTVLQEDQQRLRSQINTVETKPAETVPEPFTELSLAPRPNQARSDILLPHLPIGARPQPKPDTDSPPNPAPASTPVPVPAPASVPVPAPSLAITSASASAPALAPRIETVEPATPIPPIRLAAPAPSHSEEEGPLSEPVRATLVQRLRLHPYQRLTIRAAADNPRSLKVAIALRSAFREAGWGVRELEMVTLPMEAETLLLSAGSYPPPQEFVVAFGALAGAGFMVTSDLGPKQGGQRVVLSIGPFL